MKPDSPQSLPSTSRLEDLEWQYFEILYYSYQGKIPKNAISEKCRAGIFLVDTQWKKSRLPHFLNDIHIGIIISLRTAHYRQKIRFRIVQHF